MCVENIRKIFTLKLCHVFIQESYGFIKDLYNLYDSFNFSHQILMREKSSKVQDNSKVNLNRKPEPPSLLNKVKLFSIGGKLFFRNFPSYLHKEISLLCHHYIIFI